MEGREDRQANMKSLFKGQSERAYLFGKLEKLAHAVILLTSQSDIERSIVERLEMNVLDSVHEAAALGAHADQSPLVATLLELVSLVRLCGTAGIFTQSNASILVEEYLAVLSRLAAPSVQGIVLKREELLSGSEGGLEEGPGLWRELPSSIDDLFGLPQKESTADKRQVDKGHLQQKPNLAAKGHPTQRAVSKQNKGHFLASNEERVSSPRSQAILTIVKAKGVVSIRDVADVVTDCSEKTIQRELLALVEQGVLKKEGERRWSTYRLA